MLKFVLKLVLLSVLLNLNTISYGINLHTELDKIDKKYELHKIQPNYNYKIDENSTNEESYSKIKDGCQIEINYSKNKIPVLMKTIEKDFEFTVLHEIGHCVLGKEIFYKDIDWQIDIKKSETNRLNNLINKNENLYLKDKRTLLIKMIYHEIFADTFACLYYLQKNNNRVSDITFLMNKRYMDELNNIYETHISYYAIKEVLTLNKNTIKNLTMEDLRIKSIQIAQQTLIKYIRENYE